METYQQCPTWKCATCTFFVALTLRALMNHYFSVHSSDPNFFVRCGVDDCPATFRRYHSFYKHVVRKHKKEYHKRWDEPLNPPEHLNGEDAGPDPNRVGDSDPGSNPDTSVGGHDSESDCESMTTADYLTDDSDTDTSEVEADEPDLQKTGALYILKVKERNKMTQVAMDSVLESTSSLIKNILHAVEKSLVNAWTNHDYGKDFSTTITDTFTKVQNPFAGLEANFLQTSYVKKNLNYVGYREEVLNTKICKRKKRNKLLLTEENETFIYIPFIQSLGQLLSNKRIAKLILKNPNYAGPGLFYDICDGHMFVNDQFFKDHQDALQIIIYHDMVEVCNPLGSHAGKHKVDMFYFTLGNFNPKVRSKRCAVRLLGIVNGKLVKKYGYDAVLKPMLDDIKKLEKGHPFTIDGETKVVFGKVVSCTSDNEGQHEWGGYKVGVGFVFQKCRHCHCHFSMMQGHFHEEDFTLRTKETHRRQCMEITSAPNEATRNDLKITYGINHQSTLCELHDFDITIQLPQDIMHTLLEGVVQYEVRHLLLRYIDAGKFTLGQLNAAISSQKYGYTEVGSKPGPLKETVFRGDEKYKLKYNAAQARLFLRLLPFILSSLIEEDDPYYVLLTQLIAIVQIVFSPVISIETTNLLKLLIAEHLTAFKEMFPDVNITPKQHYLIHIPRMIKQLGPLIRHSWFGFESAHKYFKELARKQNFKNLPKSLAERCQLQECSNFCDGNEGGESHPLFSSERNYGVLSIADDSGKRYLWSKLDESGLLPGVVLENIYKVTWVTCHGTKFCKKGGVIVCSVDESMMLPIFGNIKQIWVVGDFIYFECMTLETLCFSETYQAYHVREFQGARGREIFSYESLVDFNVLHIHKGQLDEMYVPVKYDISDVVEQHLKGTNPVKF